MWKWTQNDENRQAAMPSPVPPVRLIPSEESLQAVLGLQSVESSDPDVTRIGKSVVIKGDISGGGSLYLDGELEGNVELNGSLTVGPEGRVRANLQARSIDVQGRVKGDLYGLERAELKKSATVVVKSIHLASPSKMVCPWREACTYTRTFPVPKQRRRRSVK
jgi:hypothetical protein